MAQNTVKFDGSKFNESIKRLRDNVPQDSKAVVRNEARLLVEELVDRTKPKLSKLKERIKKTILGQFKPGKQGRQAVPKAVYYRARSRNRIKPLIVVQKQALNAFIKQQQSHVGWFASGWLGSGNPLKAKRGVPSFVKKQTGQGKTVIQNTLLGIKITVTNASKFIFHVKDMFAKEVKILNAALRTREYKINQNLKAIKEKGKKYIIK